MPRRDGDDRRSRPKKAAGALGDAHNFGRRVEARGDRIAKPRALLFEWLLLSAASPLRQALDEAARVEGRLDTFAFLPDLAFDGHDAIEGGEVERIALAPLPALDDDGRRALARVLGRALALFTWLGVADLHWENLALGVRPAADASPALGSIALAPLDVEMIFADLELPTHTKLLPDADPEIVAVCRHAAGARRVLPYLGKPIAAGDLVAMAAAYADTLALLERHGLALGEAIAAVPALATTPIRVCLRGTDEYVRAREGAKPWPPLLRAEAEQLARGDIPYFFRLYGRPGIHYYADASLRATAMLPRHGDVPRLEPLLDLARGLRAPSREVLREQGLFAVLAAFDDPRSIEGTHAADGLEVTFRRRALIVRREDGEELESRRDLRAFVGSVYLPCRCGEVRAVLVPAVTACDAVRPPRRRGSPRRT